MDIEISEETRFHMLISQTNDLLNHLSLKFSQTYILLQKLHIIYQQLVHHIQIQHQLQKFSHIIVILQNINVVLAKLAQCTSIEQIDPTLNYLIIQLSQLLQQPIILCN